MNSIKLLKLILLIQLVNNLVLGNEEDKPLIQEISIPKNLNENQTVKLSCELIQGKQPVTIDWYLNDKIIEEDNIKIKIKKSDDFATLMIKYLSIDDNGDYFCLASNQYGNHKIHASVYVNGKFKKKKFTTF